MNRIYFFICFLLLLVSCTNSKNGQPLERIGEEKKLYYVLRDIDKIEEILLSEEIVSIHVSDKEEIPYAVSYFVKISSNNSEIELTGDDLFFQDSNRIFFCYKKINDEGIKIFGKWECKMEKIENGQRVFDRNFVITWKKKQEGKAIGEFIFHNYY